MVARFMRVAVANYISGTAAVYELRGEAAEKARRFSDDGDYDGLARWLTSAGSARGLISMVSFTQDVDTFVDLQ